MDQPACDRLNPLSQCQRAECKELRSDDRVSAFKFVIPSRNVLVASAAKAGGASRDRTGDLKLAKLALSQLSYGPDLKIAILAARGGWWARDELNVRPHAYQACALTT